MQGLIRGWTKHLTPPVPGWQRTDPLDRGLTAEWRFDENTGLLLPDYSGYGNYGTVTGASWIATQYGAALDFAVGDLVTISGSKVYVTSGKPFSFEAFVYLDVFTDTWPTVARLRTDTTFPYEIFFSTSANYIDISIGSRDTFSHLRHDQAGAVTGTWIHIVATYNGAGDGVAANYAMYLNGETVALVASGGFGIHAQGTQLSSTAAAERWDGKMALVRIYDRQLAAAEALAHYQICLKHIQPLTHVWMMPWGRAPVAPPVGGHMTLWGRYWGP